MHLKIVKSFGHLTKDPHVMQFPVEKSLLPAGPPLLWDFTVFCLGMVESLVVGASSSTKPKSGGGAPTESCRFFFLVKRCGNG